MTNTGVLRLLCVIAALLVLGGCGVLPANNTGQGNSSLDALMAEHNYVAATKWLEDEADDLQEAIESGEQRRAKLAEREDAEALQKVETKIASEREQLLEVRKNLDALQTQSDVHATNRLEAIDELHEAGDWREADQQLKRLEAYSLPSDRLKDYRNRFDADRAKRLAGLEHQLLMLESRQLPERELLYRALAKTGYGEASLYARLRSEQDLKNRVESSLRERAMNAEREGKLSVALQYLTALARLDESDAVKADVRRVSNWLASKQTGSAGGGQSGRSTSEKFDREYGAAVAAKDWIEARRLLDQALKRSPDSAELKAQDAFISDQYSKLVEEAKRSAEAKYTSGEIEEALSIWQGARKYAPDDVTLQTNIQRASKILEKLDQLQRAAEQSDGAAGSES